MKKLLVLAGLLVLAVPAAAAHLPILASQDSDPVYAPDGRHIAFVVNANGQGRLFALDVVDAQTRKVSTIGSGAAGPSPTWSSDSRIAWSSGGILYEAKADGTARKRYVAPVPAYAPAWRPHSEELAYLTHHGATNLDLWVGNLLWAKDAIGTPSWSPDGTELAFAREGEIWVATGPGAETRLATTGAEPGSPVFSPDGASIAYAAGGALYVVPAAGGTPKAIAKDGGIGPFAWSPASDEVAFSSRTGLRIAYPDGRSSLLTRLAGHGASFAPTDPHGRVLAYAQPVLPGCPGHLGIGIYGERLLVGTCRVTGTAGADVLEGTPSWGDAIAGGAGNDRIHANDGHTDRVDCGAGRDTVWADRTDRLVHCEVVHR